MSDTPAKKWSRSRTVWFNVVILALVLIVGIAALLADDPFIRDTLGPTGVPILLLIASIGNLILRTITTEPIKWRG